MNVINEILFGDQSSDSVAIIYKDSQLTYHELRHQVKQACTYFKQHLSPDNQRVAVCATDSIEWAVAALGVIAAGGVIASASQKSPLTSINAKLEKIDPALVLTNHPGLQHPNSINIERWYQEIKTFETSLPVETSSDDHCVFFNSGGTTGAGKLLIQSHQTLLATLEHISGVVTPLRNETSMVTAPFFAGYGSAHLYGTLRNGATMVICTSLNPNTIRDLAATHQINRFGSTPVIYSLLLKHDCVFESDVLCITASDIATEYLLKEWRKRSGRYLRNVFGTSEASTLFLTPHEYVEKIPMHSLGMIIPGIQIELRNENGQLVKSGEIGQLWFRGPMVSLGIWNEPELSSQLFIDGWGTTEDLMREEKGVYYFVGRKSDVFKIDSTPVDLANLENQCLKSQLFDDIVAIPLISPGHRTRIKLLATKSSPADEDQLLRELRQFLSSQVKQNELPDFIQLVEELPRSPAGKKIRKPQYL